MTTLGTRWDIPRLKWREEERRANMIYLMAGT
jgi:hypothetical protein